MPHPSVRTLVLSGLDGLQFTSAVMVNMADTGCHMETLARAGPLDDST